MKEKQIFNCDDIRWQELEQTFAEMSGQKPPGKISEGLLPPELAIINDHLQSCEKCRETYVNLARRYGITKGTIFSQEKKSQ